MDVPRAAGSNRRWWGLAVLSLGLVVIGLDSTVLNVALATLATDLHAGTGELQWIVDSYVLVFAAFMLPAGALGDRYGRRGGLVAGLLLFGVASAVAAWAGSTGVLIAARAAMGLGAAALAPLSLSLIPAMFAPHERPRAISVATVGIFLGLPIGPLVGGYLLDHYWWGSIFLINVPITLVAATAAVVLLPASRSRTRRRPDHVGGVLVGAGAGALVYGVIEAPGSGWGGPRTLAGLTAGLLLLAAFVLVERRIADPMLDLRLFRNAVFGWATAAVTLVSVAMFGLLFVLPQYLQVVAGHDAFGTGVRLLPLIAALVVGGAASDRLAGRIGARPVIAAGLIVLAAGLTVGSRVTATSGYGLLAAGLLVIGLGLGLAMPTAMDAIMGVLPTDDAGVGIAVTTALRMVAGALGVALLPSVISSVYTHRVADAAAGSLASLPPAAAAQATAAATDSVAGAAEAARTLGPAGTALRDAAFTAFTDGMSLVLLLCAAVALLGALLVAAFLPARRRTAPATTDRSEPAHPVPVG
jgi:EmrB/QacA subfamily drug resistance transporter